MKAQHAYTKKHTDLLMKYAEDFAANPSPANFQALKTEGNNVIFGISKLVAEAEKLLVQGKPSQPLYLKLNSAQLKRIKDQYLIFKRVQDVTSVPWQAIAAIWTRESFSVAPPKTPGGQFQFDPIPSNKTLTALLDKFSHLDTDEIPAVVKAGVNQFNAAAILAGCFIQHKMDVHELPRLTPTSPDELVIEAFYSYNGRKYGSADKSPYVMNGLNTNYKDMRVRGTIPDGKGGRIWIDNIDKNPGAFTVYKQLKQEFPD